MLSRLVGRTIARNSLKDLWIRGAVAIGKFRPFGWTPLLHLNSAAREAHRWEKAQEWIGAILCPSAVQALLGAASIDELRENLASWLVYYDSPLKKGWGISGDIPLIAVNWTFRGSLTEA